MPSRSREDALSEVIGFILILALIAVLASLYLTYVVPAQGREGEIKHMAGINDQFLGYKAAVDSLWINDQTNVPISRTFTLGTLTGTTQGSFVIPMFQPYPSSGSMVVNGMGDTISITAENWKKEVLPSGYGYQITGSLSSATDINIPERPNHIYIILNTTSVTRVIPQPTYKLPKSDTPTTPQFETKDESGILLQNNSQNWKINVVLSPRFDTIYLAQDTQTGSDTLNQQYKLLDTDLIIKTNITRNIPAKYLSQEFLINKSIISNTNYAVDLMDIFDDNYGIYPGLDFPITISSNPIQTGVNPYSIGASYVIDYGYQDDASMIPGYPHPMGYLGYRSGNNYWIQQDYYYQNGGIFLYQPGDQSGVTKVIPIISVQNVNNIPYLKISDISITGDGNIGGTSPVQIVTNLQNQSKVFIGDASFTEILPNARNVTVVINVQDTSRAQMWNQAFASIKQIAVKQGANPTWITNIQNGNQVLFTVNGSSSQGNNVYFELTRVNLSVELQPVSI